MEADFGAPLHRTRQFSKPMFTKMRAMLSPKRVKEVPTQCRNLLQRRRDRRRRIDSRSAVLTTYELLELILLRLPDILDLVRAIRVCKTWHDLIDRSKRLRRRLFLGPEPVPKRCREMADRYSPDDGFLQALPSLDSLPTVLNEKPDFHLHKALENSFPNPIVWSMGDSSNLQTRRIPECGHA